MGMWKVLQYFWLPAWVRWLLSSPPKQLGSDEAVREGDAAGNRNLLEVENQQLKRAISLAQETIQNQEDKIKSLREEVHQWKSKYEQLRDKVIPSVETSSSSVGPKASKQKVHEEAVVKKEKEKVSPKKEPEAVISKGVDAVQDAAVVVQEAVPMPLQEEDTAVVPSSKSIEDEQAQKEEAQAIVVLQSHIRGWYGFKMLKNARKRLEIVRELIQTEKSYVNSMALLIKVWMHPLKVIASSKDGYITEGDVAKMFSTSESILRNNTVLFDMLTKRVEKWSDGCEFGDIFIHEINLLNPHVPYILNYTDSYEVVKKYTENEKFAQFLQTCLKNPNLQNRDLVDYLILPVQRIPRYGMLMEQLLKFTGRDHPDRKNVEGALNSLKEMAEKTNQKKREREKMLDVVTRARFVKDLLTDERVLLHEGRVRDEKMNERHCFLFNDIMLLSKASKNPGNWTFSKEKYLKWDRIKLDSTAKLSTNQSMNRASKPNVFAFGITIGEKNYKFNVMSVEEFQIWTEKIQLILDQKV